ncbi:MAG: DNA polymerase I [Betaproteobacteria bacterium]|nr:DNA polymerase I [Betaproteobacteria bacterium]NBY14167.1 DNA polymerase I [Betaproteobacteria bacterium]NCA16300.1 DNA polymerase I [Betaproteobacteria bacterium]
MTPPRLLLVDASSFVYRAFHALPDLRSRSGHPTGAITGMINMLRRLRSDWPATYAACVFDPKGPTFRDALYPEYKANRSAMPDDLRAQLPIIFDAVRALGWPLVVVDGLEADDVIGSLAHQAMRQGLDTVIATGDKDLAQLVNDRVLLVDTMSRDGGPAKVTDVAGVKERFGVPPDRIIDYLALVGDAVDNVPGVHKVGPKTAVKWLEEFGSLDGVMQHAERVSGVVGENLRQALEWLPTARELVTVKCDADLSGVVPSFEEALQFRPVAPEGLARLRDEFDLAKSLRGLMDDPPEGAVGLGQPTLPAADLFSTEARYEVILDETGFEALLSSLAVATLVSFDTETTSIDARAADLVGLSFSWRVGEAFYLPVGHVYAGAPEQLSLAKVLDGLGPWLEDATRLKVGQNLKYDAHVLRRYGISLRGMAHDTLLQSYVLEAHRSHDLGSLAERHLGRRGLSYDEVTGKGAGRIGFEQVSVEVATQYAAEDADFTLHLHETLWPQIQSDARLLRVYEEIEMPVMRVLFEMEENGIEVDASLLEAQSNELAVTIGELEQQAHALAGGPFNLGSPKQLAEILFERLGYKPVKKTAKGAPSTDEDVLEELAHDYPLPKVLLTWRGMSKLKSTYTDKLPKMIDPKTGRVHTTFSQAVAVTGRLASSDPNLQNIPIRTQEGRRIRQAFVAPAGSVLLSADYSQIELRIMAHLSEDAGLIEAFETGQDVHRATASEIFGVPREEVNDEQRRYAKVINFGLIYGMSAFGLARNLDIERDAAKRYIERYFLRYPGVAQYMERIKQEAKSLGYVQTVFGRRLWLPEIASPNGPRRAGAERAAINAPMQGTAADLIKLAMVQMQAALEKAALKTRLLLQVHDELILEVPQNELPEVGELVPRVMENVASLRVPLVVSVGAGANWDAAH